jgi:hypothetical protein
LSSIVFNWYSKYLTKEALEGFGNFRIGGQVFRTVKYADGLVLHTNEEVMLQGMFERLIEIGSCCGMEINVEETKLMRMPRLPSHAQIMIDQVQSESVEYCNYLCGMVTNNVICTREFKYRIAVAKTAVNKKKTVFTGNLDLTLRLLMSYIYIYISIYIYDISSLRVNTSAHFSGRKPVKGL